MKVLNINVNRIITVVLVVLFNITLQFIPLASVFGYEFSVLNAIFFFLLSGILVINNNSGFNNWNSSYKKILLPLIIYLIIPPLISVTHTLFTVRCSLWDGLSFYLVNTVACTFFGFAAGIFCNKVFPRYPKLLFFIIVLVIILVPISEFYFNPQVYIYNLCAGYFPGTIYDEAISVNSKLLLYRSFNILFFIVLVFLMLSVKRRYPVKAILIYFMFIPAVFIFLSPYLGFSSTKSSVEKKLGGKLFTDHFEIIYDHSIDKVLLKNIILHHECYYNDMKKFFRSEPESKIISFIFSNNMQKGLLFGAENADVAKPWLGQIYITAESYNHTLKHEISHVFTANFGTGIFKVAKGLNPALIEGIAMASDPFYDKYYVDQLAAAAYRFNYKINIKGIYNGYSFFNNVSSLGYVYSGAFTNYLVQKYGIDRFTKWYSGESFDSVYKYNLNTVVEGFYFYLKEVSSPVNKNTAKLYFARQTIFTKACPRYTASQLRKARELFIKGEYKKAEDIYRDVLQVAANYSALTGLCNTLVKQKREKEALDLIKNESDKYSKGASYFNYELLQANFHILNNQIPEAEELYLRLAKEEPEISYTIITDLYLRLLKSSTLKEYLSGNNSTKFRILKELNKDEMISSSVPSLIELAQSLGISKTSLMEIFDKPWLNNNYQGSYAAYILSDYLMENLDYNLARKFAAIAYRCNKGSFNLLLRSHYLKSEWIYINNKEILDNVTLKYD